MPHVSAETKHAILLEYAPRSATHGFAALARRHSVKGGARLIRKWHEQWDGTPSSLQEKPRPGRPRVLSKAQVSRHVRAPILAANRAQRPVHYTTLLPLVRQKTGSKVSLRTLRRYGKQTLGVNQKHTKKRTAAESTCTRDRVGVRTLCVVLHADSCVQCLVSTVTRSQRCDASCRGSAATTSSSSMRLHSV